MSDQVETLPAAIPMPPEIAIAVLDVMSKVKALGKDAQATGTARFKYTSVDQFFELLGPLMSAAGIFTLLHETGATIEQRTTTFDNGGSKTSTWMTTDYEIWIYHKSGVAYGPVQRKIQVIASGPQSYGMGPSFVEKYFLRSLFKIPTGDDDADAHPQNGLPATREREPAKRDDHAIAQQEAADAEVRAYIGECKGRWATMRSQAELAAWWKENFPGFSARFRGKEDPLWIKFKEDFSEVGAKLPAEGAKTTITSGAGAPADKPKDDIPEFQGDGRPSGASIRMNFKAALVRCVGRDDCNEAFIKHVEPFEKSLPKPFTDELYALLQKRIDEVEK